MAVELNERPFSFVLADRLINSGRPVRCEVPGCTREGREHLQTHHVVPARIRNWHGVTNLVFLCPAHHALVERFYWQRLSALAPETARDIRRIARMFRARQIPRGQVKRYQDEIEYLWTCLNRLSNDPRWWQDVYRQATDWARSQHVIRHVTPGEAIIELSPWWVTKQAI